MLVETTWPDKEDCCFDRVETKYQTWLSFWLVLRHLPPNCWAWFYWSCRCNLFLLSRSCAGFWLTRREIVSMTSIKLACRLHYCRNQLAITSRYQARRSDCKARLKKSCFFFRNPRSLLHISQQLSVNRDLLVKLASRIVCTEQGKIIRKGRVASDRQRECLAQVGFSKR